MNGCNSRRFTARIKSRTEQLTIATQICLTKASVSTLLAHKDKILDHGQRMEMGLDAALRIPLALNNFLTIEAGAMVAHLRKHWKSRDSNTWLPSKTGVTLKESELGRMLTHLSSMVLNMKDYV